MGPGFKPSGVQVKLLLALRSFSLTLGACRRLRKTKIKIMAYLLYLFCFAMDCFPFVQKTEIPCLWGFTWPNDAGRIG
jgi:hypothetical protein